MQSVISCPLKYIIMSDLIILILFCCFIFVYTVKMLYVNKKLKIIRKPAAKYFSVYFTFYHLFCLSALVRYRVSISPLICTNNLTMFLTTWFIELGERLVEQLNKTSNHFEDKAFGYLSIGWFDLDFFMYLLQSPQLYGNRFMSRKLMIKTLVLMIVYTYIYLLFFFFFSESTVLLPNIKTNNTFISSCQGKMPLKLRECKNCPLKARLII